LKLCGHSPSTHTALFKAWYNNDSLHDRGGDGEKQNSYEDIASISVMGSKHRKKIPDRKGMIGQKQQGGKKDRWMGIACCIVVVHDGPNMDVVHAAQK
jgi:hypothetical protein